VDQDKRHAAAVARTVAWAREAAGQGDIAEAVSWLDVIEAIEGTLPPALSALRDEWIRGARSREAA
jgi:hypothetical protein